MADRPSAIVGPSAWHPADSELEAFESDRFQVRSVSIRGHSHRFEGTVRQDAMAHSLASGLLGLAVADGLGSERLSHIGAKACVLNAVGQASLAALLSTELETLDCSRIADSLRTVADSSNAGPNELRSTLIFAAVEVRHDTVEAAIAQIGDSEAWLIRQGDIVALFDQPASADGLATSAVRPLPDASAARVRKIQLAMNDVLLLTSDGVGELLETDNAYREAIVKLLDFDAPTPTSLLSVVDAAVKGYDDDRTLVSLRIRG